MSRIPILYCAWVKQLYASVYSQFQVLTPDPFVYRHARGLEPNQANIENQTLLMTNTARGSLALRTRFERSLSI